MNLANKLTLFRIVLIPVFILFMSFEFIPHWAMLSLIVFTVASITDHLDGRIARKHNLITNFGIFMDPFADKLLVTSAIIMLVARELVPAWIAIVIIAREFAVSGLRTIAANEGNVISASNLGKLKTTLQMVAVIMMLLKLIIHTDAWFLPVKNWLEANAQILWLLPDVVMYAAAFMTIYSGVDYFMKGWSSIDPSK
ncbi:CDP-diacylglycerol--glycerol-3-phosphate 3-phosphatidyltransferase [Proteiniclasticum sp. QWL-01]|uniref:CDP-diacylglycerol--glycerol-3-phosphate 3-phosphatidyltransferase n=1 Tax=Proteiniclasticum sp. QWL-01 TaxID=3036945 RepID=UPI0024117FBA|nr:CDP-diacylglycerol--glycerol-3-phosphate 3-phosphatidyltransferase [Proteiniclasticum sp. QWL-01]WFF74316.1 CDP-diacylglycerol--glycerol-3-phosphate 3-phosphatidyltransferase [Proteiniclasticum sp. QWL-01]